MMAQNAKSNSSTLELLKRNTLPSVIQDVIERMIIDCTFAPGDALREATLAEQLGVSRGPIREAFRSLEEKGLVTIKKNCGVYVRKLDLQEVCEIYEIRVSLEELIGQRAASHITADALNQLSLLLEQMDAAIALGDHQAYSSLNFQFHDRLAYASGNKKLAQLYSRMVSELALFRRQTHMHQKASMMTSLQEHRAILSALSAGDQEQTAQLMRHHTQTSLNRLLHLLNPLDTES